MNYRHAFHAGNFGDCVKHALLLALLRALLRKPAPLFVLDTHAGAGHYDLAAAPAQRTNEAATGILRLLDRVPPALRDYVTTVRDLGLYPGSPALIRSVLRPDDRLLMRLMYLEGRHADEIAGLTGWNKSLIKVRAFRARAQLRRRYHSLMKENP